MAKPNWKTYKHPPIEDPAGHNGGCSRWRRRPYTACTTMWGESITPFAQRVVHAQHASCCLLACLSACLPGRQGKITRLHTQKSLLKTAPQEMSVCIRSQLGSEFRLWNKSEPNVEKSLGDMSCFLRFFLLMCTRLLNLKKNLSKTCFLQTFFQKHTFFTYKNYYLLYPHTLIWLTATQYFCVTNFGYLQLTM